MISLQTDRLIIRDHLPEDLQVMHSLLSNPAAMYYLDDIRTSTLEETLQNLETALAENSRLDREKFYFAITDRRTGAYIGEIGYTIRLKTPLGAVVTLGYFLKPEHWGRGLATEAAREVLRYAFEDGGAAKVETGCIRDNIASQAVMIKLGLMKEADLRLHVWHDGELKDRVEYGMTKDDWVCWRVSGQ